MVRSFLILTLILSGCARVPRLTSREKKITPGEATTTWGYYGITPESPDAKRLCYARFPQPIDLTRDEKYAVYPAELWVCNADGTGHRKVFEGTESAHNGMQQSWIDNDRILLWSGGAVFVVNADTGKVERGMRSFGPA